MIGNKLNLNIFFDRKILNGGNFFLDFESENYKEKTASNLISESELDDLVYLSDRICVKIQSGQERSIYILFSTPEFFDFNLLHSKVLKRFKKKYNFCDEDFIVIHPTRIILKKEKTRWNKVEFTHDPKQGDISLMLEY